MEYQHHYYMGGGLYGILSNLDMHLNEHHSLSWPLTRKKKSLPSPWLTSLQSLLGGGEILLSPLGGSGGVKPLKSSRDKGSDGRPFPPPQRGEEGWWRGGELQPQCYFAASGISAALSGGSRHCRSENWIMSRIKMLGNRWNECIIMIYRREVCFVYLVFHRWFTCQEQSGLFFFSRNAVLRFP